MKQRILLLPVLAFMVVLAVAAEMDLLECLDTPGKTLAANEILFAYSIDGKLDALTLFNGREFLPVDGREFKQVESMYDFSGQKSYTISFGAYWTKLGKDRCIWFAKLPENRPKTISIFSSKRIELETKIDSKVVDLFYSINTDCVGQGVPCKKPELLATSDLNSNGRLEFWYSNPYTWDTGFVIAELSESGNSFDIISSKCLDCD